MRWWAMGVGCVFRVACEPIPARTLANLEFLDGRRRVGNRSYTGRRSTSASVPSR